jgi:hypothetical protein
MFEEHFVKEIAIWRLAPPKSTCGKTGDFRSKVALESQSASAPLLPKFP